MWKILYFAQFTGQYWLFGIPFHVQKSAPASLNIPSLNAGNKN